MSELVADGDVLLASPCCCGREGLSEDGTFYFGPMMSLTDVTTPLPACSFEQLLETTKSISPSDSG